jgi:hypothetical protein
VDIVRQFKTDKTKEDEGVWQDIGDDASVLVARAGNANYRRIFRLKTKGMERRLGTMKESDATKLLIECEAEALLLGWKGFTANGAPLEYSRDAAIRLLTDLPDFRRQILALADDFALFREHQDDDAVKN